MKKIIFLVMLVLFLNACNNSSDVSESVSLTRAVVANNTVVDAVVSEVVDGSVNDTIIEEDSVELVDSVEETPVQVVSKVEPVESLVSSVNDKIVVEKSSEFSPELRDLLQRAGSEVKSITYV